MYKENVHKADLDNGCYRNPILDGDYADPAVFRDNEDYYLCVSTGRYLPGLTILHSKDLVNWQIICNPLKDFTRSVWAPDILKYDNKYYIYFSAEGSNYVIWSDKILEGWSNPIDLKIGNIDPGHVVDENGKRFLFLSDNYLVPLSNDGLKVNGKPEKVLEAPKLPEEWEVEGEFPEAPNVFRRGEYYYLTYADGGTSGPATSHMIMSARAKNLYGPWELSPYNPVIHTWKREEKWISKGHGHFVDDKAGNWWVIYHAYENGYESLGRKLLLSPVVFTEDNWFRIIQDAEAATVKPAGKKDNVEDMLSDDFSGMVLKPKWKAWGEQKWSRYNLINGILAIRAEEEEIGKSHPLTIITGDHSYEITVNVSTDGEGCKAGIILMYNEAIFNGISLERGKLIIYRLGKSLWEKEINTSSLWLRMRNNEQYLSFYYSMDGSKYWKLSPVINLVSQNNNAYGGFLSLRPGIFACGNGSGKFKNFVYSGIK